jgi:hypothetical protein
MRTWPAAPIAAAAALAALVVASGSTVPRADAPTPYTIDAARVYYGDAARARRPAVVSTSAVFRGIAAWQEASAAAPSVQSGPGIARFWDLAVAANKRFAAAIRTVAARRGADLVAERGAVRLAAAAPPPEDLTDAAIAEVARDDP